MRQIFSLYEAEAIIDIPINRGGGEDIRYRACNSKGKYTICDGYYLECNSWAPLQFQSSHPDDSWWRRVWKLRVPLLRSKFSCGRHREALFPHRLI